MATPAAREDAVRAITVGASPRGRSLSLPALRMFARLIYAKDAETRRHCERVAIVVERLARASGWGPVESARLREAALLHDIGKVGVPDAVLMKPCRLDPDEYARVKEHPEIGASIVGHVLRADQTAWIRHHHERWDGLGYPDGLAGAAIPQGARLLAVADAWDAMTEMRTYREPMEAGEALDEVEREAGWQFCPGAVEALREVLDAGELRPPRRFSGPGRRQP
jgi:putative nucleotidyltransferase with HDIG domain